MADYVPAREDVIAALQAVLAWPEIQRSPQLGKFLQYIVQRTLDGGTAAIKAYSIAVDVLGRPADFDPQADPIVRVQARRLRALLEDYYLGPGQKEPIRIVLPIGRYVPEFVANAESGPDAPGEPVPPTREFADAIAPAGHVSISWFVLALITLLLGVLAYTGSPWGPASNGSLVTATVSRPSVSVTEFEVLSPDPADTGLVSGLAVELVTDLSQFETITPVYGGAGDGGLAKEVDFVLGGIVRREGEALQYGAVLTDAASGGVVWNKAITLSPEEAGSADLTDNVARRLSMVLGSASGPIHASALHSLKDGQSVAGNKILYLCRMLFDLYRERGAAEDAEKAQACFLALDERERLEGPALAAQASIIAEISSAGRTSALPLPDRFRLAGEMLAAAVNAAPTSSFVWEQKARVEEAMGLHAEAEASYRSSLQLNPANMDAIAARARHLAFIGRLDEAQALIGQVMRDMPDPPAWYLAVPGLVALRDGRYADAVEHSMRYAQADGELGLVLAIMAAQANGDSEKVSELLPRVLDVPAFRAYGVLNQLGRRIADGDLLERVRVSLSLAGIPPQSLLGAF